MAEQELKHFEGQLEITYLDDLSWLALLSQISQLSENSAVLFSTYFNDPAGHEFFTDHACRAVAATSNAPVYGILDTVLGCGIIGGSIYSLDAAARAAANLGARILKGEPISHVPVEHGPANKIVIDSRQLKSGAYEKAWFQWEQQLSIASPAYGNNTGSTSSR